MTNATISFSNHILSAEWKHFFLINEKTRIVSKVIPLVIWVFSVSLLIAKKKIPILDNKRMSRDKPGKVSKIN